MSLYVREPQKDTGHDPFKDVPYWRYSLASPAEVAAAAREQGMVNLACETCGGKGAIDVDPLGEPTNELDR